MARERRMNDRDRERMFQFVMVVFTLLIIFAYVEFYVLRRGPSIEYTILNYPTQESYCPGEELDYHATFKVTAPPTSVTVVRSLWDQDSNLLVASVNSPPFAVRNKGLIHSPPQKFMLPEEIEAGEYHLDIVAYGTDGRVTSFGVPFSVSAC